MNQRPLRIFISSPSDVRPERLIAERVVARLAREFAYHFRIEPVLWEREPLIATEHFQTMIQPPSETDIVVVILWSKLGTPLPAEKFRRLDGSAGVTGTEWEFEDAVRGYRERGAPDLLVYRKRTRVQTFLDDEAELERSREQKKILEQFWRRWFEDRAGGIKAASHSFDAAEEFEAQLETHLRGLIEEKVREVSGGALAPEEGGGIHWFKGSPFRGLQAFELEHAPVFFGRTRARNRLRELVQRRDLAREGFLLVFGASGSGKSSLVKAGLLADLLLPGMIGRVALVRHAIWTPAQGTDRLATALMEALPELGPLGWSAETLKPLLADSPETLLVPLRQALANAGRAAQLTEQAETRLCLVVDQLEELFTAGDIVPDAFARLAAALARSGAAWVVATMRSDFFHRLEGVPLLAELAAGEGQYQLLPVEAAEIAEIVRRPAREAGLRFEVEAESGTSLDSELIAAASADKGALPLLEFTLDELWERRAADGTLTFAAYRALGGLAGALAHRAEEVFVELDTATQAQLPALARALVTVGEDGTATARSARTADLAAVQPLVDALVAARLLIADGTVVRIAHEALIRHWPRLARQIEEDRTDLAARARVEQAAKRHAARPDPSLLLPAGLPLSEAEDLLARRRGELGGEVIDFVERSSTARHESERRGRRRLQTAAALFAVLAVAAGGAAIYAVNQAGEAERQRGAAVASASEAETQRATAVANAAEAEKQRSAAEAERQRVLRQQSLFLVRAAERATETGMPFLLLREALPRDLDKPERPFVGEAFAALYDVLQKFERAYVFAGERERAYGMAASPDGKWLVVAGPKGGRLFDVEAMRSGAALAAESRSTAATFAPKGGEVALAGEDGTVRIFGADGEMLRSHEVGAPVVQLLWTEQLHAVTRDGVVRRLGEGGGEVAQGARSIALMGKELLIGGQDGVLRPTGIAAHDGPIIGIAVSPDGKTVATAGGSDGTAKLWRDGELVATLNAPARVAVMSVAFTADGRRLVTTHDDAQARIWLVDPGELLAAYSEGGVGTAVPSADGRRVFTGGDFGYVKAWTAFPDQASRQTRLDMAGLMSLLIGRNIGPEQRRANLLPELAAAAEPPEPCDRMAGHPFDPGRVGRAMLLDTINARRAQPACEKAAAGGEPRLVFQYGRTLERAGDREGAARAYRAAADKGYPIAMSMLARLNPPDAASWRAKAAAAGDGSALYDLGEFDRALKAGMPLAAFRIAEDKEKEGDLVAAVRHYLLAFRLLRDRGILGEGSLPSQRASMLLHKIAPEELARIYREVEAWQPG